MATERYDSTLLGILQQEGQIAKFLDVVMGFLYRRTDFYHVMKTREEKLGFPEGIAPRLLIQAYEKYETMARKRDNSKDTRTVIPSRPDQTELKNKTAAEVTNPASLQMSKDDTTKAISSTTSSVPSQSSTADDIIISKRQGNQKDFQDNPESHNGAIREGYRWAQTLTDCDLRIAVPATVSRAKQVKVSIKRKHISASYLDCDDKVISLVDTALSWDINVEESMWSLIPKDCIHVNMEKVQERWWEHVFVDEPKINTREIDASVPMETMDSGAQSVIDQLMYDEKQKKLNLPTSKEQIVQNELRKVWDADGSPFKGTPYDPSLVNTSGVPPT